MYDLKVREFTIDGVTFHINDNDWRNEFEGRYYLTYYAEDYDYMTGELTGSWRQITTVDTAREARQCARTYLMYR